MGLTRISTTYIIGKTIKYVSYSHSKSRLIFNMDDGLQTMIVTDDCSLNKIFTRNRKYFNFSDIRDIYVKDIGWDRNFLFFTDNEGNVYRIYCMDIVPVMYNYSKYIQEKKIAQEKRKALKKKIKKVFTGKDYTKI